MLWNAFAGILASCGMLIFFECLQKTKLSKFHAVTVVGSFLTQREEGSFAIGVGIHLFFGVTFAWIYSFVFYLVPIPESMREMHFIYPALGMGLGFNHGMLAAIMIAVFFTQYHPIPEFRKVGFATAIYYALASILYGTLVGLFFR